MINKIYKKRVRKDYQRKNSPNPFFRHTTTNKKSGLAVKGSLISTFLVLIFLIWFFLAAPFWHLQSIKISGLTRAPQKEITKIIWNQSKSRRYLFFKQNNIFLFDESEAVKTIINKYNLAGVKIEKLWPHTLRIQINERPYSFIFKEGDKLFYASADGYIIKQPRVKASAEKKYFILENDNSGSLIDNYGKINIKANHLNFIVALSRALSAHPDLPVTKFIIDSELNTVTVKFTNGPLVYFNVQDKIASQLTNLLLVKKEKIKDNFNRTKYIDLRYGNRVFINPDFN